MRWFADSIADAAHPGACLNATRAPGTLLFPSAYRAAVAERANAEIRVERRDDIRPSTRIAYVAARRMVEARPPPAERSRKAGISMLDLHRPSRHCISHSTASKMGHNGLAGPCIHRARCTKDSEETRTPGIGRVLHQLESGTARPNPRDASCWPFDAANAPEYVTLFKLPV